MPNKSKNHESLIFPIFFFADYLLNRLHNIVANFDTFNIKIVMINYLKSCVGCGTQYTLSSPRAFGSGELNVGK